MICLWLFQTLVLSQKESTMPLYSGRGVHKVYEGKLTIHDNQIVTVNGQPLDFALSVENHSPTGLSWGYGGSGPAQLAIALLADAFDAKVAARWSFVLNTTITSLPQKKGWVMTECDLYHIFLNYAVDEKCPEALAAINPFYK